MKDTVKKIQTYLAFDRPLEIGNIRSSFVTTQDQQQKIIPGWGMDSTRQRLISAYWFTHVLKHFGTIFGIALVASLLFAHRIDKTVFLQIFVAGAISFLILLFFHYLPNFTADFLPKLDAIRTLYESEQQRATIRQLQEQLTAKQDEIAQQQQLFQSRLHDLSIKERQAFQAEMQQKLTDQEARLIRNHERIQRRFQDQITKQKTFQDRQQEELRKSRQAQMSNLALTLVYCALAKGAGLNNAAGNDRVAQLLQKLYGVDRGSLRNNLDLIAGTGSKRKNLGERKVTEIRNRFEEAIIFLEEIEYPQGIKTLKELEIKLFRN
jgi:hypothetical protein